MDKEYQDLLTKISKDEHITKSCYQTNNRFAYLYDRDNKFPMSESKCYNFVPTYDPWCLACDNKCCTLRCSGCKFIYFCDKECQKKAWLIHKQHCKRDLFIICILCGKDNPQLQCDSCPVKYCNNICKSQIEVAHKDYDCDTFSKIYPNKK